MIRLLRRFLASMNHSGRTLPSDALRACDFVGRDVQVKSRPFVVNKGRLSVGDRFYISSDPVRSHLVTESHGSIEIGDDVSIESGAGVASSERIRIGSGTQIGAFALIMDCDYHVVGDTDAVPATAPVEIGRNVRIGHNSTILRGTTIADNTVIPPGSTIQGQVPAVHRIEKVLPEYTEVWQRSTDSTSDNGTMVERVTEVVTRIFHTNMLPAPSSQFEAIDGWDPSTMASVWLTLQDKFGVKFSDDERCSNDSIQDVAQLLDAVTARQSPMKRRVGTPGLNSATARRG